MNISRSPSSSFAMSSTLKFATPARTFAISTLILGSCDAMICRGIPSFPVAASIVSKTFQSACSLSMRSISCLRRETSAPSAPIRWLSFRIIFEISWDFRSCSATSSCIFLTSSRAETEIAARISCNNLFTLSESFSRDSTRDSKLFALLS